MGFHSFRIASSISASTHIYIYYMYIIYVERAGQLPPPPLILKCADTPSPPRPQFPPRCKLQFVPPGSGGGEISPKKKKEAVGIAIGDSEVLAAIPTLFDLVEMPAWLRQSPNTLTMDMGQANAVIFGVSPSFCLCRFNEIYVTIKLHITYNIQFALKIYFS